MMTGFNAILNRLADGKHLPFDDAVVAFDAIMSGDVSNEAIAAFLMALRLRGESVEEITAGARVLRQHATMLDGMDGLVDTCGTGGDGLDTYNISTASALVAAAAGAKVAKHGNRSVSSKSGSSDVLAALGAKLSLPLDAHRESLERFGFTFLFAPKHHAAMRHVAPARKELGMRTIFNLLGPLSNPAGARAQLLGVYNKAWLKPLAQVLDRLGAHHVWVVHGADGMDELSVSAPTHVVACKAGVFSEFELTPEAVGLSRHGLVELAGGDAVVNAKALRAVVGGADNAYRDAVLLNAGAALVVGGLADSIDDGVATARAAIDDGRAEALLDKWVAFTQERGSDD